MSNIEEKIDEPTSSFGMGYEWLQATDLFENIDKIWQGIEVIARAEAERRGLDVEEFANGCANALDNFVNALLFEEQEKNEEK